MPAPTCGLPRAASPATRPRTCLPGRPSSPTTWRRSPRSPPPPRPARRWSASSTVGPGRATARRRPPRCAGAAGARALPQAPAPQLRGLRRAALVRPRRDGPARATWSPACRSGCRSARTCGSPSARWPPGRGRGAGCGQPQRLALLARAAATSAWRCSPHGWPRPVPDRLRQPGRRPGRAGLRRRVHRDGRRRRRCVGLRARSSTRSCSSSTSRCPSVPRAAAAGRRRGTRADGAGERHPASAGPAPLRRSARCSGPRPRSTRPSCSAPATTCRRTASPTP